MDSTVFKKCDWWNRHIKLFIWLLGYTFKNHTLDLGLHEKTIYIAEHCLFFGYVFNFDVKSGFKSLSFKTLDLKLTWCRSLLTVDYCYYLIYKVYCIGVASYFTKYWHLKKTWEKNVNHVICIKVYIIIPNHKIIYLLQMASMCLVRVVRFEISHDYTSLHAINQTNHIYYR